MKVIHETVLLAVQAHVDVVVIPTAPLLLPAPTEAEPGWSVKVQPGAGDGAGGGDGPGAGVGDGEGDGLGDGDGDGLGDGVGPGDGSTAAF